MSGQTIEKLEIKTNNLLRTIDHTISLEVRVLINNFLLEAPFTLYRINFHTGLIFTPMEKFEGVYTTPLHSVVRSYCRYRNRR